MTRKDRLLLNRKNKLKQKDTLEQVDSDLNEDFINFFLFILFIYLMSKIEREKNK